MENCIGKTGLITDKKSLFKGQNCTVVKEQKRWYVCEVEENGKPKNVYVSKGGIKFEGVSNGTYSVSENQYIPYKSNKGVTYYYVTDEQKRTINKNTGKPYKGKEMSNYKFETKESAQKYADKLNGVQMAKGGNINAKTKAKLLIINSANPLSKQLIAEGFEQFNAIDYTEVKHANFNVLTHNESKKTFVVYPERIYSQLDEETLQSDIDYMKGKGIELVESFEQGGNIDSEQKHEYMMLSRLQSDCEYFLNHGGRSERVLWAGNVVDQIKEMKSLYNKLTIKPEWISMEDILEYEKKMKESYEKGGNIPNSYEGKTAEQVWDSWDAKQRYHFLSDHAAFIEEIKGLEEIESSELRKTRNADWKKLEKDIKLLISNHVSEGQYAKGGNLTNEKIFEVKYHTREQLKKKGKMRGSMTAIIKASNREDAIAKVKKENKDFQQLVNCKATKMNVDFFEEGGNIEVDGHKLVYERWSKASGGDGTTGTIRTVPQNYYVATVHENNKITFDELDANTKNINTKQVEKLWNENKIPRKPSIYWDNKGEFVSEGKDKNGNTAIVYYNNESKKYYFTVNGRDLYNVEFETKDAAIKHLIGKGFEMQFYSDKRSVLQIEREIKELENEMEKNKNDYEAAVARIEKIKGEKLVELSEIKSVSSEGAKPQQGWLVGLNEEQIEFLCGLINRYGTVSEHPKATKENLGSFKYEYLKNLISNVNQNEIEEGGMSVLNGLKTHFNI